MIYTGKMTLSKVSASFKKDQAVSVWLYIFTFSSSEESQEYMIVTFEIVTKKTASKEDLFWLQCLLRETEILSIFVFLFTFASKERILELPESAS